jgi:GTP cyclohydrolase II
MNLGLNTAEATLGTPRTRAVHRAIAEARRGVPVVLAARRPLIIAPAETVGAEGLRLIDLLSGGQPVLLLAPFPRRRGAENAGGRGLGGASP